MPSDKIASICVLHLMKHLFRQFIHDIRNYEEDENLKTTDDSNSGNSNSQEVKIPAIQLFDELGKLFDRELRQSVCNSKAGGNSGNQEKGQMAPGEEEEGGEFHDTHGQ